MTAAVLAVATAVPVVGLTPAAAAQVRPGEERVVYLMPGRSGQLGTNSATSGGRTGDFTGDGVADIMARGAVSGLDGQLRVYQHSGVYQGTATYRAPVTINHGWQSMRWIGQGRIAGQDGQPRGLSDVVAIDEYGQLLVYPHSGTYDGTATITAPVLAGTGWTINDLVYTYDVNADGWDDIVARRKGTGETYVYENTGGLSGTGTFRTPALLVGGGQDDREQNLADFSGDGVPELMFLRADGTLALFSFVDGHTYELGYGWQTINAITLTDINRDGRPDILGRHKLNGTLGSYTHTGRWQPDPAGRVYTTLNRPLVVGYQWWANDVIS